MEGVASVDPSSTITTSASLNWATFWTTFSRVGASLYTGRMTANFIWTKRPLFVLFQNMGFNPQNQGGRPFIAGVNQRTPEGLNQGTRGLFRDDPHLGRRGRLDIQRHQLEGGGGCWNRCG